MNFKDYFLITKYLNLKADKKIYNLAKKIKIAKGLTFFEKVINQNNLSILDIYYIDLLTKFFLKKNKFRFQLNIVLALHECNYFDFIKFLETNKNYFSILTDFIIYFFILITLPLWIIYKIILYLINKLKFF